MKIRLISDNADFYDDLLVQMNKYIENFEAVKENPDVIIVDENTENLRQMRCQFPSVPLILLTSDSVTRTDSLNLVLHKPFSLWKLTDLIHSANNLLDNSAEGVLVFNQYRLQPTARKITDLQTGDETKLTEKEVNILKYLYKMMPQYVSKNDLQVNVWEYNEDVTTHTVETHIYRLRQKVEKDDGRRLISTDNGKYKLNTE